MFKKTRKAKPAISTASLPDIIFILLFFFMVVTVLKNQDLKVDLKIPEATELTKLSKKSLVSHFYIGVPKEPYREKYGNQPRLQISDQFANISDIPLFLESESRKLTEIWHPLMTVSLKVDNEAKMGLVNAVKTELRKNGQLKVNYAATRRLNEH